MPVEWHVFGYANVAGLTPAVLIIESNPTVKYLALTATNKATIEVLDLCRLMANDAVSTSTCRRLLMRATQFGLRCAMYGWTDCLDKEIFRKCVTQV